VKGDDPGMIADIDWVITSSAENKKQIISFVVLAL
jgi:hypothetical protein